MNERVKKLWIEALRSGRYRQCQSQLKMRTEDGPLHCCLGVLEEVAQAEGVIDGFDGSQLVLDEVVVKWAGLERKDPYLEEYQTATALNDGGRSFNYIADRIEKLP